MVVSKYQELSILFYFILLLYYYHVIHFYGSWSFILAILFNTIFKHKLYCFYFLIENLLMLKPSQNKPKQENQESTLTYIQLLTTISC